MTQVYLPPDANCLLTTLHHCLRSKNYVNLIIGSKQPTAVYLTPSEAAEHCAAGAGIFHFASTPPADAATPSRTGSTERPAVVLCGIGTETTFEAVQAAALLRKLAPSLHVRVANVTDLMVLSAEDSHPHALSPAAFDELFPPGCPVLFNYHGYASELRALLFCRLVDENLRRGVHGPARRVEVRSYEEEGSTTTPFDMMLANRVSRFHVAAWAVRAAVAAGWNGAGDDHVDRDSGQAAEAEWVGQTAVEKEIWRRAKDVKDFINKEGKGLCARLVVSDEHLS